MLAPARLCTSEIPQRSSTDATIVAVVVLPLVADTSAEPAGSLAESWEIARGRGRVHTTAVSLAVRAPDAVAGDHERAATIERQLERRWAPADERPQRAVRVDEVPPDQPRLVGDPIGLRIEPAAGDAEERAI